MNINEFGFVVLHATGFFNRLQPGGGCLVKNTGECPLCLGDVGGNTRIANFHSV